MAKTPRRMVRVGGVALGGDAPVSVQSMTKTVTSDVPATVAQIRDLEAAGCDLVRAGVPDMAAARALGAIKSQIHIPLVADIHFDHRLALEAIAQGVDKLRLNPGNLQDPQKIRAVVEAAAAAKIPIRVGVNCGSLPHDIRVRFGAELHTTEGAARALVEAALVHIELLEELGFGTVVVSLKSFDVPSTIRAYEIMAQERDYPLHVGITEAGVPPAGSIRSAVGIGALLARGLGDTVRVSLTADPVEEVRVAVEVLRSLNLRAGGVTLISCPTCARCHTDLQPVAVEIERRLRSLDERLRRAKRDLRVAVMGCEVNGPGEAREADVGIAAGPKTAALFVRGEIVRHVLSDEMTDAVVAEAERLAAE
jgi:(E)-4-hydroxy-3-methylbut-2-enyl-diphosphate synthase